MAYTVFYMKLLPKETFLALARGSEGANMFRSLFADPEDGSAIDILKDGQVSCAFYVSSLLVLVSQLPTPHATVSGLEKKLQEKGWEAISDPIPGSILFWVSQKQADGDPHEHVGIYLGNDEAISHSDKALTPTRHHYTFGGTRETPGRAIRAIYTHKFLS